MNYSEEGKARAYKYLKEKYPESTVLNAEFKEEEHKRGEEGKFLKKGGATTSPDKPDVAHDIKRGKGQPKPKFGESPEEFKKRTKKHDMPTTVAKKESDGTGFTIPKPQGK